MHAIPVSAVMICGQPGQTLETSLASLARFDEVLVYLNGDSDASAAVCAQYANVTAIVGSFVGFGPTKQAAVEAARHDWVFCIDSDEHPDPALVAAIADIDFDGAQRAFNVLRKNRFMGQHVRRGGWGNDVLLRVFHRGHARFNDNAVHEKVIAESGNAILLDGALWHEAVTQLDQFLQKISRYSELAANAGQGKPGSHPAFALLRAHFAFFRSYILQLGFLAGWRGIVIAQSRAVGTFYRYAKRYTKSRHFE